MRNPNKPPSGKNGGNMKSGGHSQSNIIKLNENNIEYKVIKTYDNGVRIGGVKNHKESTKAIEKTGQSWFPENWDNDKILIAGTYTANKGNVLETYKDYEGNVIGIKKFSEYDGVIVGVFIDVDNNIATIFPDEFQRKVDD